MSFEALIARYLTPSGTIEDELGVLAGHSREKQEIVRTRLEAIDRFLSKSDRMRVDAEAIAHEIGISGRQFYALIAKVREFGPSRALLPGYRNVARAAPTRDGLTPRVEELLQSFLQHNYDARLATVEGFVRAACATHDIDYPGASAIRRRVHILRRERPFAHSQARIGAEILIDQICLELAVSALGSDRHAVLTLIVDRQSRRILGYGLTMGDGIGLGLTLALGDFSQRAMAGLSNEFIAPSIGEILWVIPPGLEELANSIFDCSSPRETKPIIKLIGGGPRRHGEAIMRLVGDRIGRFRFKRLSRLDQDPPISASPGIDIELAHRLIGSAVESYNADRGGTSPGNISEDRAGQLSALADELQSIFNPVLDAVETRFVRPSVGPHLLG